MQTRIGHYMPITLLDSQLRALAFLHGAGAVTGPADVLGYGPVWGTGNGQQIQLYDCNGTGAQNWTARQPRHDDG